jgi:CBS domain-containing protein
MALDDLDQVLEPASRARRLTRFRRGVAATDPGSKLVRTAMTVPAVAVRASCHVSVAVDAFMRTGMHHLVVVDENSRAVGVVAHEHVTAAWLDPESRRAGRIEQVLAGSQPTATPDMTVRAAARLMVARNVDVLPVVSSEGAVQGVLTASDIVALVAGP